MIELFLDFETTGLPNRDEELDHESQPHIMEMALVKRVDLQIVVSICTLVQCPVEADEDAFKLHGITKDLSGFGMHLGDALPIIQEVSNGTDRWISHNAAFEQTMLGIATRRTMAGSSSETILPKDKRYCTMLEAKPFFDNRPPKLEEALRRFATAAQWGKRKPLHRAMGDVEASMIVYDAIQSRLAKSDS